MIRFRNPFKLFYVIDLYQRGYLFRVPYFAARWFCDKWAEPRGMHYDTVETWAEVLDTF